MLLCVSALAAQVWTLLSGLNASESSVEHLKKKSAGEDTYDSNSTFVSFTVSSVVASVATVVVSGCHGNHCFHSHGVRAAVPADEAEGKRTHRGAAEEEECRSSSSSPSSSDVWKLEEHELMCFSVISVLAARLCSTESVMEELRRQIAGQICPTLNSVPQTPRLHLCGVYGRVLEPVFYLSLKRENYSFYVLET